VASLRIVLIHDYRRLLLRDPELPDILLAAEWPRQKARLLCKELYRRLVPASERHLDRCLVLANGTIPPPTRPSPTASRRTTRWRRCRCRLRLEIWGSFGVDRSRVGYFGLARYVEAERLQVLLIAPGSVNSRGFSRNENRR
jgi:PaaX-like protein C-terminal domain